MKVGVYIDAYNLYYGMRGHCGRGTAGWRWLNVRSLAESLCGWRDATVTRVVYCTARVDPLDDQSAFQDQDVYLRALKDSGAIDVLELGRYVARAKKAPLATPGPGGSAQIITPSTAISLPSELPILNAGTMYHATVRVREEKGSDVNVATHLLADVFRGEVQGAIVMSNDSDLALPLTVARTLVPVGTVNPGTRPLAGALGGNASEGAGNHWWRRLSHQQYRAHQFDDVVAGWSKPADW